MVTTGTRPRCSAGNAGLAIRLSGPAKATLDYSAKGKNDTLG